MNLKTLLKIFSDKSCQKIYVKRLSANDNSKNQFYFGGSFDILNILPIKEITTHDAGDWKRTRFKTELDFSWVNDEGVLNIAPDAQLILYPKYPEVRFSGFLKGSKNAPSALMANRIENRLLFLGITDKGKIIGFVASPESEISREFDGLPKLAEVGVFKEITISNDEIQLNTREQLINELKRIHQLGWIDSKRLKSAGNLLPCNNTNCGGYTLEAELGVFSNGLAEPDYLGWEIKQFAVRNFKSFSAKPISLMDHSPSHGFFAENGAEAFIKKYGYADKMGRESRFNFGGTHKFEKQHKLTSLKLIVEGFDANENKITNPDGFIGLIDMQENMAASWSFASLIKHWNKKHSKACYVPSLKRENHSENPFSNLQYSYGNKIILGSFTDITLFLKQVYMGNIYYDPAIKLELAIEGERGQKTKTRSLFRINSLNLSSLYKQNEIVDLNT
jgi:MvaI/BcnI restriction endonuclease family